MRKWWAVMGGVFLLATFGGSLIADEKPKADGKDDAAALVKRGEYLVNRVGMCVDCHTPHTAKGEPDKSKQLQGGPIAVKPKEKPKMWADEAPDITRSGVPGKWGEDGLVKFLTTGVDPKGEKAAPPMPPYRLEADDARAVAAYLRSLPGEKKDGTKRDDKDRGRD